jgi:hypothetical protein
MIRAGLLYAAARGPNGEDDRDRLNRATETHPSRYKDWADFRSGRKPLTLT